jgi:hypothetical protein
MNIFTFYSRYCSQIAIKYRKTASDVSFLIFCYVFQSRFWGSVDESFLLVEGIKVYVKDFFDVHGREFSSHEKQVRSLS